MNALANNQYTRAWALLGETTRKPRVVLCVSAHWYKPGVSVTAMERPRTIHDFGGFPRALFDVQYSPAGDPALAEDVVRRLQPQEVAWDQDWGLDHGAWTVLRHMFPSADVPVVQLSIDETKPAHLHYALGRALAELRDENVLIVGSGNLVHNLHTYAWGDTQAQAYDWAIRFENMVREAMLHNDHGPLIQYEQLGRDAALSVPTPDHFLPLLYVLGTQHADDPVSFVTSGFDGGSVSMLSVQIG
jgi:4,5-DOPA dioxygenase extradiol